MNRIRGLDAIRLLCALWVVMGHFGGPPVLNWLDRSTVAGWWITGIYGNFWNGPAAVIVFFVISGFCIHYPYSEALRIPAVAGYLARRYIRICIPMAVAILLSSGVGIALDLFHDSILWSLAAELIYYSLYPLLLRLRRAGVTWRWMIAAGYAMACVVAATDPLSKDYAAFGLSLNWLVGLPCWLIGCELAECVSKRQFPAPVPIWRCRFWVWGLSVILSILNFHSPLTQVWTLNPFALVVGWWLAQEIRRYADRPAPPLLELAGRASYSLYLIHLSAYAAIALLALPDFGDAINWLVRMLLILGMGWLFYLLVEAPAHNLARFAGRSLAGEPAGNS
jgi:peptidoglycan/LPS O-acetylase OafA/YrhL